MVRTHPEAPTLGKYLKGTNSIMNQTNVDALIITDSALGRSAGSYRIATELRDHGYSVQVIDYLVAFGEDDLRALFAHYIGPNTKILGIGGTYLSDRMYDSMWGLANAKPWNMYEERFQRLLAYAKELNPAIKVVLGGSNTHIQIDVPGIDVFLHGDADISIIEYMKFMRRGLSTLQYERHPATGAIIVDGNHRYKCDFSHNDCQIFYHSSDFAYDDEFYCLEISRGCTFNCSFCDHASRGRKLTDLYVKSEAALEEEILRNYHEHGITSYSIVDSTFNENMDKMRMLARIVQRLPFEFKYSCYVRIDLVMSFQEQYSLFRDSNLVGAFLGIESLNPASLKAINKYSNVDKIVAELHKLKEEVPKCGSSAHFIAGLPYDSMDTMTKWTEQVMDPSFPSATFYIQPLYITKNANKFLKSKFDEDSSNFYSWDNGKWINNMGVTEQQALEFSQQVLTRSRQLPRHVVGGWNVIAIGQSGVPGPVARDLIMQRNAVWKDRYKALMMAEITKK